MVEGTHPQLSVSHQYKLFGLHPVAQMFFCKMNED
jgi:hypothetical protein